jgi:flagellar motor switch protein FliN/FliY
VTAHGGPETTGPSLAASIGATQPSGSLDALLDVAMPVVIEFGRTKMTLQELLQMGPGSVIELDRAVGEPVDIYVSDRRLARGEVVVVGDHFGVRVTQVLAEPASEAA